MNAAFKEWRVIVEALGRGEQIIILRKGGIREGKGGFKMEHLEFALFPTEFHQQRESVIDSARTWFDEKPLDPDSNSSVFIEYQAVVREWHHLAEQSDLERLRGQHIWRDEVLADRFEWGREKGIFAIALRVYKLGTVLELPLLPEYGGCKSWIELAHEIPLAGATPVLDDAAFEKKLKLFRESLQIH